MPVPRLKAEETIILICDVQQRFRSIVYCMESVIHASRMLTQAASIFSMPILVTEQNSKGLGPTVEEIATVFPSSRFCKIEKTKFSMITEEAKAFLKTQLPRKKILLCGIESHVCIAQTALDLIDLEYEVFIVVDGISSQRPIDRLAGIKRMEKEGAIVTTVESALFEIMGDMQREEFKKLLPILKEKRKNILPSL